MRPEELREKLKTKPLYIIDENAPPGKEYAFKDLHDEIKRWKFAQDALKRQRVFKRLGRVLRRALFNLLPRLTKN